MLPCAVAGDASTSVHMPNQGLPDLPEVVPFLRGGTIVADCVSGRRAGGGTVVAADLDLRAGGSLAPKFPKKLGQVLPRLRARVCGPKNCRLQLDEDWPSGLANAGPQKKKEVHAACGNKELGDDVPRGLAGGPKICH